jgi:hypothetical protein
MARFFYRSPLPYSGHEDGRRWSVALLLTMAFLFPAVAVFISERESWFLVVFSIANLAMPVMAMEYIDFIYSEFYNYIEMDLFGGD